MEAKEAIRRLSDALGALATATAKSFRSLNAALKNTGERLQHFEEELAELRGQLKAHQEIPHPRFDITEEGEKHGTDDGQSKV